MKKLLLFFSLFSIIAFTNQSCKKGCTDSTACNYNSGAKKNDGTCTLAGTWYEDADGDGKGNPAVAIEACEQPAGYVSNSTDASDIPVAKKQRATMIYNGATWCGPCGDNGEPAKAYLKSTYSGDAVLLSIQDGDDISTSSEAGPKFSQVFSTFSSVTSIPHAWYAGHGYTMTHGGFSSSASSNNSTIDSKVTAIKANAPSVGIGAVASRSGNTIKVNTKAIFYNATSTQHYIGVYLLEDGINAFQTGPEANTDHNNVLRAKGNGSVGDLGLISMGTSFTANQTVEGVYTITASSSWNASKFKVVVLVWEGNTADKICNAVEVSIK